MAEGRTQRRLTTILAADVIGYSRLMEQDEVGTLGALKVRRKEVLEPLVAQHQGRVFKVTGDGVLVEFTSAVNAVQCAVDLQQSMAAANDGQPEERHIVLRIGVNLGDVMVEGSDLYGDGVNIAARLEAIAEPGGIVVSGTAYDHIKSKVKVDFEDVGAQRLKNIAEPVRIYRVGSSRAVRAVPALALPDKPSIAVLPFENMSGDQEQEYFADGMVEEIITALSRIHWLFVIARNSSFIYKGRAIDIKQVGRELGVRYVLEGSIRKAGQKVRITGQLIDALDGSHLWADRFDGSVENVFDLQDTVAINVAGAIEPTLQAAEIRRSSNRPTQDLDAYDLYLRALPLWRSLNQSDLFNALEFLEQAVEHDPRFGPALALAAVCRHHLDINGWTDDKEANRLVAVGLARRAILVAGDDPDVLAYVGFVFGYFGEDIGSATALIDRALELNANFARGWFWSGWVRLYAGDIETAIRHFETSMRLSPRDRWAIHLTGLGVADFLGHRFDSAVLKLRASLDEIPGHATTYRFLAASYAHMGKLDDARDIVERLCALTSIVMPNLTNFRKPEHRALLLAGLRLAIGK
jgi:adenylate cyclase